jgi:hypothetical protein
LQLKCSQILLAKSLKLDPKQPSPAALETAGLVLVWLNWLLNGGKLVAQQPIPVEWSNYGKSLGHQIELGDLVEDLWKE